MTTQSNVEEITFSSTHFPANVACSRELSQFSEKPWPVKIMGNLRFQFLQTRKKLLAPFAVTSGDLFRIN